MKKLIVIISLTLLAISGWAQSNIRVNNFWSDTYFINPSAIHPYNWQFSLGARKQWINFPGAPITGFLTGTYFIENHNTQLGIALIQDFIGYTYTTNAKFSYAYSLNFNRTWNLQMGLAICGQSKYYDVSQITVDDPSDPTIYDAMGSKTIPNSDLGLELSDGKLTLGLSTQNILSLLDKNNDIFVNSNFLYGLYRIKNRNALDYSFGLAAIESQNIFQMEANANVIFKLSSPFSNVYLTPETFGLGLYYRTWGEIGVMVGVDLSADWNVSYTYDYNVTSISQRSYGTHELIFRYRFKPRFCH